MHVPQRDHQLGFLGGSVVKKNPPANAGDMCLIPGLGRSPGERNGNPLQYSRLGNLKPHGQRSFAGPSPLGHEQSDTAEHAHLQRAHNFLGVKNHTLKNHRIRNLVACVIISF